MPDVIIAGCGFAGATAARILADMGKKVYIAERRPDIGGNMYDSKDENGILIHHYGPHIYHTNFQRVHEFLSRFTEWVPYTHSVKGRINGKLVPVPFNFTSLNELFGQADSVKIIEKLKSSYGDKDKVSVMDLLNHEDAAIKQFGQFVFDKVFVNYTAKQWGVSVENVDKSVIDRVPVVLSYEDSYFKDFYQFMPANGFTPLFEKMLDHENITVELNQSILNRVELNECEKSVYFDGKKFEGLFIYTGAIDELFDYKYGELPYRSVDMSFEMLQIDSFQSAAVVNYPNEENFTRITEFKNFTNQSAEEIIGRTTILREYPSPYSKDSGRIPYYPVINVDNLLRYQSYAAEADKYGTMLLCGRLAEYKYYNMDAVISAVMDKLGAS